MFVKTCIILVLKFIFEFLKTKFKSTHLKVGLTHKPRCDLKKKYTLVRFEEVFYYTILNKRQDYQLEPFLTKIHQSQTFWLKPQRLIQYGSFLIEYIDQLI